MVKVVAVMTTHILSHRAEEFLSAIPALLVSDVHNAVLMAKALRYSLLCHLIPRVKQLNPSACLVILCLQSVLNSTHFESLCSKISLVDLITELRCEVPSR